jgi:hypothetical protein
MSDREASKRAPRLDCWHPTFGIISPASLLADEELACAMGHQAALLFGRLGLDKPHVGSGYCFADGLSVGGIILLPLDVGS